MSAPHEVDSKLGTSADDTVNQRGNLDKRQSGRIIQNHEVPSKGRGGGCCGCCIPEPPMKEVNVVLIGGGVMSATLGLLLKQVEPTWEIALYERLGACGEESSNGWNNAGTGHSALCELNYTKEKPDGTIDATKAFSVNEQFQLSRQFWAHLCDRKLINSDWIQSVAHMSFVTGEKNVAFLKKRYDTLSKEVLFKAMQYSEDAEQIKKWAPLLVQDRDMSGKRFAATHMPQGTDVDFGALTKQMVRAFQKLGGTVLLYHTVSDIRKDKADPKSWICTVRAQNMGAGKFRVKSKFVFAGAGGWAILMLQKAGIPAVYGYAGGPVSGQFLVCQNPEIVKQHKAKVYTKGEIGSPPMSEPHLDARIIDGKEMLLFGPYAGLNTRFLKTGNLTDAIKMIKYHNLGVMICAALQNFDLVMYLLGMLAATKKSRMADLHQIMPSAQGNDWSLITAGMRVQVIKKDPATRKYVFQFGTEVVFGPDHNIVGLLGASPGASTAVQVCFDIVQKAFPDRMDKWKPELIKMVPSFGQSPSKDPALAAKILHDTAQSLDIA